MEISRYSRTSWRDIGDVRGLSGGQGQL